MKRKHLPIVLVAAGSVLVMAGLWMLFGVAAALVALGFGCVALGLLMEV